VNKEPEPATAAGRRGRGILLADFGTVFFGKVEIAERTMKIHPRSQHMGIDNKDFFASWTRHFDSLTHGSSY
jgi:hypothetical protein